MPDTRLPEQLPVTGKLRTHYPVVKLCRVSGAHAAAANTVKTGLISRMAGGLYYAVRYRNFITSVIESSFSIGWQTHESPRADELSAACSSVWFLIAFPNPDGAQQNNFICILSDITRIFHHPPDSQVNNGSLQII